MKIPMQKRTVIKYEDGKQIVTEMGMLKKDDIFSLKEGDYVLGMWVATSNPFEMMNENGVYTWGIHSVSVLEFTSKPLFTAPEIIIGNK